MTHNILLPITNDFEPQQKIEVDDDDESIVLPNRIRTIRYYGKHILAVNAIYTFYNLSFLFH